MPNKETWSLHTLYKRKNKINTQPDYQRPAVWSISQKQLLIDTILRDYDIPKIYLHEKEKGYYDVIDGQQRITTIWQFYDGNFALPKNMDLIDNIDCSNKHYHELEDDISDKIDAYDIDLIVLKDLSDEEIREMFLRLQNGTTLKAQEKRNAIPGKMRDFVKELAKHDFFNSVNFDNARLVYDQIAAQMCLLSINGNICTIKDKNLNDMYYQYKDFNKDGKDAKNILRILNYLHKMFPNKAPELKRYNVISLFILINDLYTNYDIVNREKDISNWFISFEKNRILDRDLPEDERDPKLVAYEAHTMHSTDGIDSLTFRNNYLKENLLENLNNLHLKDSQRSFDEQQKQVIYRRDNGICQFCGIKCDWNAWEADHIIPWSKGGKTEVENGQVLCPSCNSKKSNKIY